MSMIQVRVHATPEMATLWLPVMDNYETNLLREIMENYCRDNIDSLGPPDEETKEIETTITVNLLKPIVVVDGHPWAAVLLHSALDFSFLEKEGMPIPKYFGRNTILEKFAAIQVPKEGTIFKMKFHRQPIAGSEIRDDEA